MASNFNPLMEAIMARGQMFAESKSSKPTRLPHEIERVVDSLFDIQYSASGQPLTIKMKEKAPMLMINALSDRHALDPVKFEAMKEYQQLRQLQQTPDETGAGVINNPLVQSAFVRLLQQAGPKRM